jgi:hypothetical protein
MPTSYNYFKEEVKDWILENVSQTSPILDVGPGEGTYSDLLSPYGYYINAIEIWEPYVDKYNLTSKYKEVFIGDIANTSSTFLENYGFIIMGDILEHISVEKAELLINNLYNMSINMLVAVPYQMEQGIHEDNIYETHLQPDLTPKVIEERYPELQLLYSNEYYGYYIRKQQKVKKAFVLYFDESYLDIATICCQSIRKHSETPICLYILRPKDSAFVDPDVDIDIENIEIIYWECDIRPLKTRNKFIKREDKQIYKILIERPKIIKDALSKYAEVVAYIDTDSIATERIDSIFDYFDNDSLYPYFTEGIYEYLIVNGRGGADSKDDLSGTLEAPACELFGSNQMERHNTGYRQTGYFVAGQKCIDFLELWSYRCNHPIILKNNAKYASFNEETILQTILYDYKAYNGLPYCYINGLHNNLEYKNHEYFLKEWVRVPLEKNHLFYHGEKDVNKLNKFNV